MSMVRHTARRVVPGCVILLLGWTAAFPSANDAEEVALGVLDELFITYRESHFHFTVAKQKRLTEIRFRPGDMIVDAQKIEPADELNGTDWKGYLDIPYSSRDLYGVPPLDPNYRWGCWSEGVLRILLQRTNDSWSWSLVRSEFVWLNADQEFTGNLAAYLTLGSGYCGQKHRVGSK